MENSIGGVAWKDPHVSRSTSDSRLAYQTKECLRSMNKYDIHVLQRQHPLFLKKSVFSLVCVLLLSLSAVLAVTFFQAPQEAHAANWVEIWNDEFSGTANTGADSQ